MELNKSLEESTPQAGNDEFIAIMKRDGIPLTRENYLELVYAGNPPETLSAEEEEDLPEMFQNKS